MVNFQKKSCLVLLVFTNDSDLVMMSCLETDCLQISNYRKYKSPEVSNTAKQFWLIWDRWQYWPQFSGWFSSCSHPHAHRTMILQIKIIFTRATWKIWNMLIISIKNTLIANNLGHNFSLLQSIAILLSGSVNRNWHLSN